MKINITTEQGTLVEQINVEAVPSKLGLTNLVLDVMEALGRAMFLEINEKESRGDK